MLRFRSHWLTAFTTALVLTASSSLVRAQQQQPEPYDAIAIECEDMQGVQGVGQGADGGWRFARWGYDLYQQNTFGGHWASRMANAMSDGSNPDQPHEVHQDVTIPRAGRYKIWAKYECPPFFNYPFGIRIHKLENGQPGPAVFEKTYGLRESQRHFSFNSKPLAGDLYWSWGMDHDAAEGYETDLQQGAYRVVLFKAPNVEPSAARSVDAILITSRITDLSSPDFPRFPLLDELQKLNHCYFQFTNTGTQPIRVEYDHWAHRYNHFYSMQPKNAIRFYDADGHMLVDESGQPLIARNGWWDGVLAPGQSTPWIDLGPTMTTENSTPVWAVGKVVDEAGKPLAQQPDDVPLRVAIATAPSNAAVVKRLDKEPDYTMLAFNVMPDLHRPEGVEHTKLMRDVYRDMTAELNQTPMVGPMPKRLRLMGGIGSPLPRWNREAGAAPFRDAMDYNIALGLNNFSFPPSDDASWTAGEAYYASKNLPVVQPSARHHHTQKVEDIRKMIFETDPATREVTDKPIPGARERFYYNSFGDEIGLPRINPNDPALIDAFRAFLKQRKVNAADLGLASLDEAKPLPAYTPAALAQVGIAPPDSQGQPTLPTGPEAKPIKALYWWTHQFIIDRGVADFREKTEAMRALVGPHFHTTANLGGMHPFYWMHQASFIDSFRGNAMTLAWSEDYDYTQPEASRLVIGFQGAYLRAGAKYHDTPMQFYIMPHYPGNSGRHLLHNVITLWGQGIKDIDWFSIPPDAWTTENYIHSRGGIETGRVMRLVSGMAGNIEDALLPARTRPARVAILLSETSDVWEVDGTSQNAIAPGTDISNVSQEERKALWNALRRAGYLVDLITEHDVADGYLDNYKALYIVGHNLESSNAAPITSWVNKGGTLVLTAGAARRDEYDQPTSAIDALVGRTSKVVNGDYYKGPLRAKLELPQLPSLGTVTLGEQSFDARATREDFEPALGAQVIAKFDNGAPAMASVTHGQGRGYYLGTLPGQAFLHSAFPFQPMTKGGHDNSYTHFEPQNFDAAAHAAILLPLEQGSIQPDVITGDRTIVANLLDSDAATLVTLVRLINVPAGWLPPATPGQTSALPYVLDTRTPVATSVRITIPGLKQPRAIRSALGAKGITAQATDAGLVLTLPELDAGDVIVLQK